MALAPPVTRGTWSLYALKQIWLDIVDAVGLAGVLRPVDLLFGLWTADLSPTAFTTKAELLEPDNADWAGYGQGDTTGYGTGDVTVDGRWQHASVVIYQTVGTDGMVPQTVRGWFAGRGTEWLYAAKFATPVPITDSNDVLTIVPYFSLPTLTGQNV